MTTENNEKSLLQRIIAQTEEQIKNAIEKAIEEGANISKIIGGIKVDEVLVFYNSLGRSQSVVLSFNSSIIKNAMMSNELERLEKQKQEIEKQIEELKA